MSHLALRQLTKIYNPKTKPVTAVDRLEMTIERGDVVALLGSSGCGKTSTLRMIAGFEAVSEGAIELASREVQKLAPSQRGVAMAFEGYSLYPPLTVRENIGFALRSSGVSAEEIKRRVEAMADMLEISSILDRYPSSISGGQQQRASLGRALVREAELHLLDEPMGQLEPQLRAVLRGRIKHYLKEKGYTAILVTHDQTEANALADRIAVMEDGVLQQYASPDALRDAPANLFTGTFIGEPPMNVIDARVDCRDDQVSFTVGEARLQYPRDAFSAPVSQLLGQISRVHIGVRPHVLTLTAESQNLAINLTGGQGASQATTQATARTNTQANTQATAAATNQSSAQATDGLPAAVVANQWLGDQSHVATDCGGVRLVAVEHERVDVARGDTVRVRIGAEDLHLFDADNGRALAHGRTVV